MTSLIDYSKLEDALGGLAARDSGLAAELAELRNALRAHRPTGRGELGDGVDISVPIGTQRRDQIVLADEGSLVGESRRRSILMPTDATARHGRFISSANFGTTGCHGPTIHRLRLDGDESFKPWPWGSELGAPEVAHAIDIDMSEGEISHTTIEHFRGDAIRIANSAAGTLEGRTEINQVHHNRISQCYNGIVNCAIDTQITDNVLAGFRGVGIAAQAGNTQLAGNHVYGGEICIQIGGLPISGECSSDNDNFSDGAYGMWIRGHTPQGNRVSHGFSQHCWRGAMRVNARTHISGTYLKGTRSSATHPKVIVLDFDRSAEHGVCVGSSFVGGEIQPNAHTYKHDTGLNSDTIGVRVADHLIRMDRTLIVGAGAALPGERGLVIDEIARGGAGPDNLILEGLTFNGYTGAGSVGCEILRLGMNCVVDVWGPVNQNLLRIAAGAGPIHPSNRIYVNGVRQKAG